MADTQVTANPPVASVFETRHLKADLKGRSVRGGAATILGQGTKFTLQIGSTMVLARLLTPQDFGLIAMVTAVTGFGALFKDLGLSMATVQQAEITHAQISVLFWVNVGISVLIALITAGVTPVIAWFYGEPRLVGVALALSLTFLFGGLAVQHQALLQRQMRFQALAVIPVVSMMMGMLSGIATALLGGGYWALVVMQLVMPLTDMLGVWAVCRWRPSLPTRRTGVRDMLGFGANLTGSNVLNYLARNLDNILIGKVWGAGPLGLYSKAYSLLMFPLTQINAPIAAVAIPALSRLEAEPERYRHYYLRAVSAIGFITMPLVAFLIVMSPEIIRVMLGPQWNAVWPIFTLLGIAALGQPISNTAGWLYVSQGRTRDMLTWGGMGSAITITAIVVGLPWGVLGVAASYTGFNLAAVPLFYWFLCRKGPVRAWDIWGAVAPFLWASLCVLAALLFLRACVPIADPLWALTTGFMLTLVLAPAATAVFPAGRKHLRALVALAPLFLRGSSFPDGR